MAGNYRLSDIPVDPTPESLTRAFRSLVRQLNDLLAQMEADQDTRIGLDGQVTLTNHLNAQGMRLTNISPSTTGTDAVNRDEVQGLLMSERAARRRQRPTVRAIGDNSAGTSGVTFATTGNATIDNNFASCATKLNQIVTILNSL